jgi:hypothetical protein
VKWWGIAGAVLLTLSVCVVTRVTTPGTGRKAAKAVLAAHGFQISSEVDPVHTGQLFKPRLIVRVSADGPVDAFSDLYTVLLVYFPPSNSLSDSSSAATESEMELIDGAIDDYSTTLPIYPSGTDVKYYFKVQNRAGNTLISLPKDASEGGALFTLTYEGIPPMWMTIVRYAVGIVTIFTVWLSVFSALGLAFDSGESSLLRKQLLWLAVLLVTAGVISAAVNARLHGGLGSGGWPVGRADASDATLGIALVTVAVSIALAGLKSTGSAVKFVTFLMMLICALSASANFILTL